MNIFHSEHQLRHSEENLNVMVMLEMHIFHVIDIPEVSSVKLSDRFQVGPDRTVRYGLHGPAVEMVSN